MFVHLLLPFGVVLFRVFLPSNGDHKLLLYIQLYFSRIFYILISFRGSSIPGVLRNLIPTILFLSALQWMVTLPCNYEQTRKREYSKNALYDVMVVRWSELPGNRVRVMPIDRKRCIHELQFNQRLPIGDLIRRSHDYHLVACRGDEDSWLPK